jgi:hypothetical protein
MASELHYICTVYFIFQNRLYFIGRRMKDEITMNTIGVQLDRNYSEIIFYKYKVYTPL